MPLSEEEERLITYAHEGNVREVRNVLRRRVDVNAQGDDGSTALMTACQGGYSNVVKVLLLHNKLDVNVKRSDDLTALEIARNCGYDNIVGLLQQYNSLQPPTNQGTDTTYQPTMTNNTQSDPTVKSKAKVDDDKYAALQTVVSEDSSLAPYLSQSRGEEVGRNAVDGQLPDPGPKIVIVTTARAERYAVLDRLDPEVKVTRVTIADSTVLVGRMGLYDAMVVQTTMGTNTTKSYLDSLLPKLPSVKVVAAVGFGWGAHPALKTTPEQDQRIGDVMFSSSCIDVSHFKTIPGSIEVRGNITSAGPHILASVNDALIEVWQATHKWPNGWIRDPTVHIGPYLSSPTLMNDGEYLKKVLQGSESRKPIGGDMETYQVAEAARKANKSWFTVKSICDFGGLIPKDDKGQKIAAVIAADFMHFMMSRPDLLTELLEPPISH
jgi:nucleoside phosphorylase